ncbi:MAG: DUF3368 domain-containing protein [Candidatus Schekmanbacteria bacterium]|nr:DUF3368 domain-containing protein [Candidatus Schekmanbacteria bacterium]
MSKVVSNSTPLIALSKIGYFSLLQEYFSEVYIPQAVYSEVVERKPELYGAKEVASLSWVKTQKVQNQLAVETLRSHLGAGESEAIVLATESKADLLLLDEASGRRIAQSLGLKITGTVGVLLKAAKDGKLDLKESLDRLLAEGFRLSEKEYQRILKLV